MYIGSVTIIEPVALSMLTSRDVHKAICKWSKEHSVERLYWDREALSPSVTNGMIPASMCTLVFEGCHVRPEEFTPEGHLYIGPFKAAMLHGDVIPEWEEDDETPTTMAESFKLFMEEFFRVAEITPDMQESIWNMSLRRFCNCYCEANKAEAHQEEFIITRRQLLKLSDIVCPKCGHKGTISIVDGFVGCRNCGHIYGDVDSLPE